VKEALLRLIWLIPTAFLVGFIYAALRSDSLRQFLRHGLRLSLSILFGMVALGLVIYWLSQNI